MSIQIVSLKSVAKKEAQPGNRFARVIAKKGKIGSKTMESQAAEVPVVSIGILNALVANDVGREWLADKVQSVQDGIIRSLVEAGKMAFFPEQIGLDAILKAMQADAAGRFSKESVAEWFAEYLESPVRAALLEKFGAGTASSQIDKMVTAYVGAFQILANRVENRTMPAAQKASLIRVLAMLPDDHESAIGEEIAVRIETVTEASAMATAL
jgi:hypothetical protein